MRVFRICKEKYGTDLSGTGARLAGGRWNSKGVPLVYSSTTRALAALEVAVHLPLGLKPVGYVIVTIEISEKSKVQEINHKILPDNWSQIPPSRSTQIIGDSFYYEQESLLLRVPSAIIQGEFNFLINPSFHSFQDHVQVLNVEPFSFDTRLFTK